MFHSRLVLSTFHQCCLIRRWPQGSVLSVTLFALKINSIVKAISPGVECSLNVDDFLIVYRSKYIHIIERHLQRSLNMLSHSADTNGFKFSRSKTVTVYVFLQTSQCSAHPNPELTLNGTLISSKFLGVIFDNKLTFLPHIRYLKEKCVKALNLLRVVDHITSWGADQHTLLHLYRSLVRSKLDYDSVVYGSTRESYLRMLDPIQNHALRLRLGAFRISYASSMCVQANEPPLIRRRMLSIQYSLRLGSSPSNPAYNTVFSPKFKASFSSKPNQIPTSGIRVAPELEKIGFKRNAVPATPK